MRCCKHWDIWMYCHSPPDAFMYFVKIGLTFPKFIDWFADNSTYLSLQFYWNAVFTLNYIHILSKWACHSIGAVDTSGLPEIISDYMLEIVHLLLQDMLVQPFNCRSIRVSFLIQCWILYMLIVVTILIVNDIFLLQGPLPETKMTTQTYRVLLDLKLDLEGS